MRERIHYFDIAKGIVILATMFMHTGGLGTNYVNPLFYTMNIATCIVIYPYFMPMYFLIRGYYYRKELTFGEEARIAATRLLLPMVLLYFWIDQWFCWAMFFALLIHHQLRRIKNQWARSAIYLVIPFVGSYLAHHGYNWHWIGFALMTTPFLHIGEKCRWLLDKKASTLACGIIYLLGGLSYLYIFGAEQNVSNTPYISEVTYPSLRWIPFYIIMGVSGSVLIVALARWIGRNKYLEYVGRNSLIYFLFHFTAIHLCNLCLWDYLQGLQTPDTYVISAVIYLFIFAIAVVSSTAVSIFINRYCPWVVGKGL